MSARAGRRLDSAGRGRALNGDRWIQSARPVVMGTLGRPRRSGQAAAPARGAISAARSDQRRTAPAAPLKASGAAASPCPAVELASRFGSLAKWCPVVLGE